MDIFEKLKNLYNDLAAEGYNPFYIYGINKSAPVNEIMNKYKKILENNISAYKNHGDYFIRLFVKNKDIFKSKELFDNIPYYNTYLKLN
jgi:preprotein translocase subunit Sec63